MIALPLAPKLAKLIPLLGSDKDGEVVATARAIGRTLEAANLNWHALARALTIPLKRPAQPESWRGMVKACLATIELLNARELDFLTTLARSDRDPTPKQKRWLNAIFARVSAWRAA